jgi:hypothetical protein
MPIWGLRREGRGEACGLLGRGWYVGLTQDIRVWGIAVGLALIMPPWHCSPTSTSLEGWSLGTNAQSSWARAATGFAL